MWIWHAFAFVFHASPQCVLSSSSQQRSAFCEAERTNNRRTTQTLCSTEAWTCCRLIVLDHLYPQYGQNLSLSSLLLSGGFGLIGASQLYFLEPNSAYYRYELKCPLSLIRWTVRSRYRQPLWKWWCWPWYTMTLGGHILLNCFIKWVGCLLKWLTNRNELFM